MELSTVAQFRGALYRLVGTNEDDTALTEQGEAQNDVAYQFLTRGCRAAQRWMLKMGYTGWKQRSTALVFTGTDDTIGGRRATLPSDFLRAYGDRRRSALTEANGDRWGQQIEPSENHLRGNLFYIEGDKLWLARQAGPPTTLYLDYHFLHPAWSASVTIDFPLEARSLIVAEAANRAKQDNWLPGGPDMEGKIVRALAIAREDARGMGRPTKAMRQLVAPVRHGNRW